MCCNATGESFSSERGALPPDLSPNDECAWTAVARFGWVLGRLDLPPNTAVAGGGLPRSKPEIALVLPPSPRCGGGGAPRGKGIQKPEKSRKPVGFGPSGPSLVSSTGDAEKTASLCVRGPKGSSLIHRTSEGRRWLLRIGRWP